MAYHYSIFSYIFTILFLADLIISLHTLWEYLQWRGIIIVRYFAQGVFWKRKIECTFIMDTDNIRNSGKSEWLGLLCQEIRRWLACKVDRCKDGMFWCNYGIFYSISTLPFCLANMARRAQNLSRVRNKLESSAGIGQEELWLSSHIQIHHFFKEILCLQVAIWELYFEWNREKQMSSGRKANMSLKRIEIGSLLLANC